MSDIVYFYIDDQADKADGIAKGLTKDGLRVEFTTAQDWNSQIEFLKTNRSKYKGLLLDLQLKFPTDTVKYDAPALAQQLRNLAKEGTYDDLPILLCTTDALFVRMYDNNTNEDLFDHIYYKEKWSPQPNHSVFTEFKTLADDYVLVKENKDDWNVLLETKNNDVINQIKDKLNDTSTIHGIASFILKQMILIPGLLVDEELLAIRLGIDKNGSPDWSNLLTNLDSFKYKGVFHKAWPRWWIGDVMKWWRNLSNGESLRTLDADTKVHTLKEYFDINGIKPISTPNNHKERTFWHKCELSGTPMSSSDGFLIKAQDHKLSWQDKGYISNYHVWNIDSLKENQQVLGLISSSDVDKIKAIFNSKRI